MAAARASSILLLIIYLGFISLGLPDGSFGVAWPPMHTSLGLPVGAAGVVIVLGTLLSATAAFTSGRVIGRFGTGPVVLVSCALTGSSMLILANAQSLWWLLAAAVPLGLGAGAVDAGLNGYVARHYSGRHMNWLHACWGLGATSGPLVMAQALGGAGGWRGGYTMLGALQLSLALLFLLSLRLWTSVPERAALTGVDDENGAGGRVPTATANSPAGWLSAGIFAVYVAAEMTAGLWAGSILVLARDVPAETAARCVSVFYAAITAGRIGIGFVVERWGNRRLVNLGCAVALVGAGVFALAPSVPVSAAGLLLLGVGLAPVYPGLMHEVPRRFAPEAVQVVIGRQSGAAALGAAVVPAAAGALAVYSLEAIAWVVVGGTVALIAAIGRLNRLT